MVHYIHSLQDFRHNSDWMRHQPPSSYIKARKESVNQTLWGMNHLRPVLKRQSYIIIFQWRNFLIRAGTEPLGGPLPSSLTTVMPTIPSPSNPPSHCVWSTFTGEERWRGVGFFFTLEGQSYGDKETKNMFNSCSSSRLGALQKYNKKTSSLYIHSDMCEVLNRTLTTTFLNLIGYFLNK